MTLTSSPVASSARTTARPGPHILNAGIDHDEWCEWTGLVPAIILWPVPVFRCPGCWKGPDE